MTAGDLVKWGAWLSAMVALAVAVLGLLSDLPAWLIFARAYACLLVLSLLLWVLCRVLAAGATPKKGEAVDLLITGTEGTAPMVR